MNLCNSNVEKIIVKYGLDFIRIEHPHFNCLGNVMDFYIGTVLKERFLNSLDVYIRLIYHDKHINIGNNPYHGNNNSDLLLKISYTPMFLYLYWWPGDIIKFNEFYVGVYNDKDVFMHMLKYLELENMKLFSNRYGLK